MKTKDIRIGTATLSLLVGYSDIYDQLTPTQSVEKQIAISRGNYTPEQYQKLGKWGPEEIDKALRQAAPNLIQKGITPLNVSDFVDDRIGEVSEEYKQRFKQYCGFALKALKR